MHLPTWVRWLFGLTPEFIRHVSVAQPLTIGVIIPAHNESAHIAATIESVLEQSVPLKQIIVVDDGSTDGTGDIARCYKEVMTVRPDRTQGSKPRAQNFGLQYVDTDVFVTIDADTLLERDAVEKILPYFYKAETASVCGSVIPRYIDTVWERGRFIEYLFGSIVYKGAQNQLHAVLVSSGCFSMFRTSVVKRAGGFPPGTIAEDMDLTWQLSKCGYRVYFHSDAHCFPIEPRTFGVFVAQIDRWYRGMIQNVMKHSFGKRKRLGFIIYWYIFDTTVMPVLMLAVGVAYFKQLNVAIALLVVTEVLMVAVPSLIKGYSLGRFWKTFTSLPAYFVLRPVNLYVFWRAIWREWIRGDRLVTWVKGHE
ncbi:MAG: glycosyltransferase [Candidatus Pacebacteria bacterium]|nr:glycosyltransferase [Candidatus Paceibacterota bacterium]